MPVILSILPALLLTFQGAGYKLYAQKGKLKPNEGLLNVFTFAVCILFALPVALQTKWDWLSVAYGCVHGVFLSATLFFYNKAMSVGKVAFNNFVVALSMVIPLAFSAVFLQEQIKPIQWAGLVVFAVAAYLVCFGQKTDGGQKTSPIAYVYAGLAALCNGIVGALTKLFANVHPNIQQLQYLEGAFVVGLVAMVVMAVVAPKTDAFSAYLQDKWFIICAVIVSVATALGNIAFVLCSSVVEAPIFFPVQNGANMIFGAIAALFFKEKLSAKTAVGIAVGVVAALLLNL